jgi:hypothetical protein
MGKSLSGGEEKKSGSSYSIIDSNSNSTPIMSPVNVAQNTSPDEKIALFNMEFDKRVDLELEKLSAKYLLQIETYEKKGLNALTKKLIEKT